MRVGHFKFDKFVVHFGIKRIRMLLVLNQQDPNKLYHTQITPRERFQLQSILSMEGRV